ncbi:MAG TPA: hypothetical protein VHS59_03105, partial [Bacillota bacterium]|nr:hypothetical protein [Bacillota bacterium]
TLPRIYAALVDRDRVVRTRAAALLNEERELPRDLWQVVGKKELSARELEWLEHAAKQLRESGGGGQAD